MKVTIIEGSPEELADYEARTGVIGQAHAAGKALERLEDPLATGGGQTIGGTDFEDEVTLRSFIFGRAREPRIGAHVEAYVRRMLELGGTEVEIGTSKDSKDGRSDSLLIYDAGPRRYGAVAYVSAKNAGLTLRLTRDDVSDVAERVKLRDVQPHNKYQVNCPVTTPDAIDLAVKLTQRALDEVRRAGHSEPHSDSGSADTSTTAEGSRVGPRRPSGTDMVQGTEGAAER